MRIDQEKLFPLRAGSPPALPAYAAATLAAGLMGLMGVFVRQLPLSDETIALARSNKSIHAKRHHYSLPGGMAGGVEHGLSAPGPAGW